jgi:hypothetical protein
LENKVEHLLRYHHIARNPVYCCPVIQGEGNGEDTPRIMRFSEYSLCHLVFIRDGERILGLDHLKVTLDPSEEISGRTFLF